MNGPRIESLRAQMDALGRVPGRPGHGSARTGGTSRNALSAELADCKRRASARRKPSAAPIRWCAASTHYCARGRPTHLLAVDPYPWNPSQLADCDRLHGGCFLACRAKEFNNTLGSQLRMRQLRENLPVIGLLALAGSSCCADASGSKGSCWACAVGGLATACSTIRRRASACWACFCPSARSSCPAWRFWRCTVRPY